MVRPLSPVSRASGRAVSSMHRFRSASPRANISSAIASRNAALSTLVLLRYAKKALSAFSTAWPTSAEVASVKEVSSDCKVAGLEALKEELPLAENSNPIIFCPVKLMLMVVLSLTTEEKHFGLFYHFARIDWKGECLARHLSNIPSFRQPYSYIYISNLFFYSTVLTSVPMWSIVMRISSP